MLRDDAGVADDLVYLDHAASTPWRDEARHAYLDAIDLGAANASGSHRAARRARRLVDDARESLAGVLGAHPGDVVFTSGGTESDDLAIRGRHAAAPGRVLCSAVEHPAVLDAVAAVGGASVPVDGRGVVDAGRLRALLDDDVTVVSIMAVNNEVGTIQPVTELAELIRSRSRRAVVHTDAVQALPWIDLRTITPGVDLLSLSAHKFGGPQGVGACVVRSGTALAARHVGGGQERERRSGTHNVAGIVAMAVAAVACDAARAVEQPRIAALRDRLVRRLEETPGVVRTATGIGEAAGRGAGAADDAHLAAGFAHVCVDGVENEALLFLLDDRGVCASAASACASGAQHPSHVLAALGIDRALASGSLRFTLGHTTTESDVDRAGDAFAAAVAHLRQVGS